MPCDVILLILELSVFPPFYFLLLVRWKNVLWVPIPRERISERAKGLTPTYLRYTEV